jgi:hypothetical protein
MGAEGNDQTQTSRCKPRTSEAAPKSPVAASQRLWPNCLPVHPQHACNRSAEHTSTSNALSKWLMSP